MRLTSSCFAERANTPPRPSVHRANCHLPPETRGDRIPVTLQRLWSDSQSDPCGCHRPVAKDVVEEVRRREAPARATCRRGAPRDTVGVVPPAGFLGSSRLSPCPPARPGPRPRRRRAFRTLCHPITRPPRRDELRALSYSRHGTTPNEAPERCTAPSGELARTITYRSPRHDRRHCTIRAGNALLATASSLARSLDVGHRRAPGPRFSRRRAAFHGMPSAVLTGRPGRPRARVDVARFYARSPCAPRSLTRSSL